MTSPLINETQLQAQIDDLKIQFPDTQDAYREACVLLFFRYGITPTANKLYQYVRKGSMSAPADALNKFWAELRDKSRVRIERADIPENIGSAAGDFVAKLWVDAQKAAQEGFTELIENATTELHRYKIETEASRESLSNIQDQLSETKENLENVKNKLSEADYLIRLNTDTLAMKEKSLKSIENEKSDLFKQIELIKSSFSKDLEVISLSLHKAETRYDALERKSLLELDQARQQIKNSEKSLRSSLSAKTNLEQTHKKEIFKLQTNINQLRDTNSLNKGKLMEIQKQLINAKKLITSHSTASLSLNLQNR